MRLLHLILICIFAHTIVSAQITFSEIMFDVATDENHDEFIEIYNLSCRDSIDLAGWHFSDSTGTDLITARSAGTKIPPHSFAVILDGSYFGNSDSYDNVIPDSIIVLTIDNNTFGSGGLANSSGELLSLIDAGGNVQTCYRYSIGNKPGYSDEKVILEGENNTGNWQDSRLAGGTPGFHNSVSPWPVDLGWQENSIKIPEVPFEGDSITIEINICNLGLQEVEDTVGVYFFVDQNENYLLDAADRPIAENNFYYSSVGNSILRITWNNLPAGRQILGFEIRYTPDQNRCNNVIFREIVVLMRQNVLHMNEIKFLTREGESEWIEIINSGLNPLLLKGWSLADLQDTIRIDSLVYLYPQQLKVLCAAARPPATRYDIADSLVIVLPKFLNLNNDEDELTLLEPGGRWLERMHYEADWLQGEDLRRVSLERINPLLAENKPESWGPAVAVAGGTPAAVNSIYAPLKRGRQRLTVSPNPFSPDGDGFQDAAIISGEMPENSARIRVQIFDLSGRLIRTLQENRFSGRFFNLVWDGKDGSCRLARIGIYIIFLQMLNVREGVLREMKTTVVLAHEL